MSVVGGGLTINNISEKLQNLLERAMDLESPSFPLGLKLLICKWKQGPCPSQLAAAGSPERPSRCVGPHLEADVLLV